MPRDKKILYWLSAIGTAGLLPFLAINGRHYYLIAAAWLALCAVAACMMIHKRRARSLEHNTVLLLTVAFVLLYTMVFYLSGLGFGFLKTTVPLSFTNLIERTLPLAVIIVASEVIRRVLLSQEDKPAGLLAFLIGLLSQLIQAGGFNGIVSFSALMDTVGLALLPAVSAGLLCQFLSARHGALPAIAYRALVSLLPHFIPVTPNVPDALLSFTTLFLPLLLLLFIRALFEKRKIRATASPRAKKLGYLSAVISLLLAAGLMAVISCQFRYGTIVIATGSMTGELNVGDAIIYERYEGQSIETGDIVVFKRDTTLVIHRVVDMTHIDGATQYYTKGDANEDLDVGFITADDIVGITHFKISYIGYPSLWMHRIFKFG